MDLIQQLLLLSEKLYSTLEKLAEDHDNQREEQIELVNKLLDARGQTIDQLLVLSNHPLKDHQHENRLQQLNTEIINRLHSWKSEVVIDMKQLQVSMKSEERYVNPYSALQNRDGTYFDGRK
ncbi:flagellar protein FliT [Kurthia sibirica]|uniref:Flagellar protein FliT n=1 Tax=Kurthia sibirica TaxID=202750 RepID=A0A2U3AMP0_9BACL|nr:flagellar protein FliT [Kurthia sibirica]PWI25810.1 flagellar protein FliT [Kurthia sibirica]GEK33628.1 hypothetical protein KSI01_11610 [Kurthia sibirica]